jgi:glycosyltransferase involved in cell wall biosynthesis
MLARHTDRIIAISESQKRDLSEVFRIAPEHKIEKIPLGFELEPFLVTTKPSGVLRSSLFCDSKSLIVGWIGRFAPVKAPALFLDCAAEIASPSVHFVMVGDGVLRESCETRILQEGLTSCVHITGWRRDLPDIHSDLDIVVSTSINEGTPVALLEAMASGKPFVASDVGGTRDLMLGAPECFEGMQIYENAILVPRDCTGLTRAIRFLLERPSLRVSMGMAGRQFVQKTFSLQRLTNDLEQLYLSLAKSKGAIACNQESSLSAPMSAVAVSHEIDC